MIFNFIINKYCDEHSFHKIVLYIHDFLGET